MSSGGGGFEICPFCNQNVPSLELQRHANDHFDDDGNSHDFDFELAQQLSYHDDDDDDFMLVDHLSLSPPPASSSVPPNDFKVENHLQRVSQFETILESSIPVCEGGRAGSSIDEKICYLVDLQIRETYSKVKCGLIDLLRKCLEVDPENSTSILSGHVDHFQSMKSEDSGWGCGWRNIQMLSSHLLMQRLEAKEVLFGGCGFVPDIASLQRWLEIAWEKGFDTLGSNHFDNEIYGKRSWIGTTECATMFRSFGLRARVVDFCGYSVAGSSSHQGGKRKSTQVSGPMDRFVTREGKKFSEAGCSRNESEKITSNHPEQVNIHQHLIDWVWSYFSDNMLSKSNHNRVIISGKAPLYFQHHGHSRTIVGIQVERHSSGLQQYNLLILDPGHRTEVLERSLINNAGWKKLIKRGISTLKKPEYQVCYIDPGIAAGEELEKLKTLNSLRFESSMEI